jgi:hypothetical protein
VTHPHTPPGESLSVTYLPLAADAEEDHAEPVTGDQVTASFEQCRRAGLMVSDDRECPGLALPENPGW